jgi:colanic acid/amylovoran biosynthesis protein
VPVPPLRSPSKVLKTLDLLQSVLLRRPSALAIRPPDGTGSLDGILDISGFASGDQWGSAAARARWWTMHALQAHGVPLVFLPQAWGPFHGFKIRFFTSRMLARADLVFARDEVSFDALRDLGGLSHDRMRLADDIAFRFESAPAEAGKQIIEAAGGRVGATPLLGVTPNMRAYEQHDGEGTENEYIRCLARICSRFIKDHGCQVVAIPHELGPKNSRRDDSRLVELLGEALRENGRLVPIGDSHSAAELKSVIGHLDLLVGSRYHSVVAALSKRVPVVALGWSHKYAEVMRSAGLEGRCCDVRSATADEIAAMVESAWASRRETHAQLAQRMPSVESSALQALEAAAQVIDAGL